MPEAKLTFQPINEGGTRIGLRHLEPPMHIEVLPHRITVDRGGTSVNQFIGETGYRWGGNRLLVSGRSPDKHSRMLVNHEGHVLFVLDPDEPITVERAVNLAQRRYTADEIGFTERYQRLDVTDPTTFERMTYAELILFTRTERRMTQQELAEAAGVSVPTIQRAEREGVRRLLAVTPGDKTHPLYNIVREGCRREIARR
jgi:DNA-binding XRE family transcriptional regulator